MKFKTEYKRKTNNSYMIMSGDIRCPEYEIIMLQKKQIKGLLTMEIILEDGIRQFWFDITGKKSLDIYMRKQGLKGELLQKIFEQLAEVMDEVKEYMLAEERIYLDPEHIFIDNSEEKIYFCYYPAIDNENRVAFTEFMEIVLQNIDHTDQKAVSLGYEIYQRSIEENSSLKQIILNCRGNINTISRPQPPVEKEVDTDISFTRVEENILEEKEERADISVSDRIKEGFNFMNRSLTKKNKESKEKSEKKWFSGSKKNNEYEGIMFMPQEEEDDDINPTVYMGAMDIRSDGVLRYRGNMQEEDLIINKDMYLIGSKGESVDGVIHADSISRVHAQISKKDGKYFIEDMNSKNGTYVNGKQLDYKESLQLNRGDEVIFAVEKYIFM